MKYKSIRLSHKSITHILRHSTCFFLFWWWSFYNVWNNFLFYFHVILNMKKYFIFLYAKNIFLDTLIREITMDNTIKGCSENDVKRMQHAHNTITCVHHHTLIYAKQSHKPATKTREDGWRGAETTYIPRSALSHKHKHLFSRKGNEVLLLLGTKKERCLASK